MEKLKLGLIGENQSTTVDGVDAYILEKITDSMDMSAIRSAVYESLDALLKDASDDTVVELQVTGWSPVTTFAMQYFNEQNVQYAAMIG